MEEHKEDIGYEQELNEGETLFEEGDKGEEMYLIKEGKIRIVKEMEDKKKTLAILEEGDFFGEMAVLDKTTRSASAVADTDVKLIIVDRDAFLRSVNKNPFIKYILSSLTDRLRKTDEMLKYYSVSNERVRFIRFLRDSIEKDSELPADTHLDIKGKEISDMTGISQQKVKKYLAKLRKYRIIELNDTIKIKSPQKLKKYEDYITLQSEFE